MLTENEKMILEAVKDSRGPEYHIRRKVGGEDFTLCTGLTQGEAKRIVACVNACHNVPTVKLEGHQVSGELLDINGAIYHLEAIINMLKKL